MKSLVKRDYPGSANELYSVCGTAIGNFNLFIGDFILFRNAYKAPFEENLKTMLSDAVKLPDGQRGYEQAIILHGKMERTGSKSLRTFRLLKRYIINAFADIVDQKAKLTSAGSAEYKSARDGNWDDLQGMNESMIEFIADNKDALEANENMPITFEQVVNTSGANFKSVFDLYKLAEQSSNITAAKVAANNALYEAIMNMLLDGQAIFEENGEIAERFVFTRIRDMINIPVTGIKVKVKSVPDNMPATDAQVSIQKAGEPAEILDVNEDGELQRKVAAGPVTLVISAPGKKTETIMINLDGGSYKSVNVELQNAA